MCLSAAAVVPALTPAEPDALAWECAATDDAAAHPSYSHLVTLCNATRCPLAFQMSTEGPFTLLSVVASVPQDGGAAFRSAALLLTCAVLALPQRQPPP